MSTKFVLNYTILYIYCVDLLMWSPTKLDFLFYDFLKIQRKQIGKRKSKPLLL